MSGFDTAWLDLREPADHAARDAGLLRRAAAHLGSAAPGIVVDLGCGTGSTVRALAPHFAAPPIWRLVDHDRALLDIAIRRLGAGTEAQPVLADLGAVDDLPLAAASLVTASALFDLVSEAFLVRLADRLAREGLGLYAALNYDGSIAWREPDPLDRAVVQRFNRHQRGDKGFGPALGPEAGLRLAALLAARGFAVETARSPWRLGEGEGALHAAFLRGVASAVAETGALDGGALEDWHARRRAAIPESLCEVGHVDVLALPPG